jgi:hypothetical protein
VHLSVGGWRIKTVPSRLSAVDIARLRQAGARPAGPPPAGPAPGALAATSCVEVQRLVNSSGIITLANQAVPVGSPLAGQLARIRLDGQVMHVITQDGVLWRTLPCPVAPGERHKLQGVRLAGPQPLPPASPVIQRKVSSRGGIRVARQRVQVGLPHAGQVVTVELGDTSLRVTGPDGELLATVLRTSTGEISRFKAHGTHALPLTQADKVKSPEGGGSAAAHLPGAPRRLRGRPSGPKGAPHRAARDQCRVVRCSRRMSTGSSLVGVTGLPVL